MLTDECLWKIRGAKLREMREQLGLSVEQVSVGVGVSENRLSRLEKGFPVNDGFMMERAYIYFLEIVKRGICPYSVCCDFEESIESVCRDVIDKC